jgi:small nuclear ribonucleoprotein (snRNP)-like protein
MEEEIIKKKGVTLIQKSLGIILVSLQGECVVVELKNDIELSGIIEEADSNMNLTLHDVQQTFPNGFSRELDIAFVNGSQIRYVHIPSTINAVKNLRDYVYVLSALFNALNTFYR